MKKWLGNGYFKVTGWRLVGERSTPAKFVAVVAPHTSNWDFVRGLAIAWILELNTGFVAKEGLFRPPLSWLLRAFGGIPVRRDRSERIVDQMARVIEQSDSLVMAITPEGTRNRTECWKSGFYHVARTAHVPIVPIFLDYPSKTAGVGPALHPSENVSSDMDVLRAFFAGKTARYPEQAGPIRLEEESS